MVFKEHFSVVVHAGGFMDFVTCLADFALLKGVGTANDDLVMGSIQLLQLCARYLVQMAEDEIEERAIHAQKEILVALHTGSISPPSTLTVQTSSNSLVRSSTQPYLLPSGIIGEDHFFLKWFPILAAFSRVTIDSESLAVRTRTLDALFETLMAGGYLFNIKYWKAVYKNIIIPVFDDLREQYDGLMEQDGGNSVSAAVKEGRSALWIQSLRLLVDLMTQSFATISSEGGEILSISLKMVLSMLKRRDEKLATSAQICLHQFIQSNIGKFGKANCWDMITDAVAEAFGFTAPAELLNCEYEGGRAGEIPTPLSPMSSSSVNLGNLLSNMSEVLAVTVADGIAAAKSLGEPLPLSDLDFELTIIKCVTHIEVLQSLRDIALTQLVAVPPQSQTRPQSPGSVEQSVLTNTSGKNQRIHLAITIMPAKSRERILQLVYDSYAIARAFNADYDLRHAIWRKGLVQQMPNLVKQETIALSTHIRILFAIYRHYGDPEETERPQESASMAKVLSMLVRDTLDVFERFVLFLTEPQQNNRDIVLWSPVIVMIVKELLAMEMWWHTEGNRVDEGKEEDIQGIKGPKCLSLKKMLPKYFRLGIRMMSVDRVDVRSSLQTFLEKVSDELFETYFKHVI
ncbi:guanine nucleotide exchange protein for ADP-robosylation factor [Blyttiomyces sp. JEL0837]|nr:guanine nucleotide exchange protein for ADP-robosylation factor [Blyttiomyces sp. JEL0837]